MADIFGKINNAIGAASAVADMLGMGNESKKTKRAIEQTPDTVIASCRMPATLGEIFPEDLGNIYFGLGFKEYTYAPSTGAADPESATVYQCSLPIPKELNQEYNVDWAADQIGPYVKPLLDVTMNFVSNTGGENLISQVLDDPELAATIGVEAGKATGKAIASKIAGAGGIKSAISLGAGYAENPNDRALLKGIPLRQHRFSWRLSPRNQGEYTTLVSICRNIREKMLPERTTSQTLLKFPYVADVKIYTDSNELTYFKTAAVQSFSYNLAPDAAPVMLAGGEFKPATFELQLTMIELEALSRKDFAG